MRTFASSLVIAAALAWVSPASGAGALDPGFDGDGFATATQPVAANGVVVQPDGKVVAQGGYTDAQGKPWVTVTRFLANGNPDRCFGNALCLGTGTVKVGQGITSSGTAIALQADGKILSGAGIRTSGGLGPFGLGVVRLNANGTKDTSFGASGTKTLAVPGCSAGTLGVAQAPDGSVLLTGVACNDPLNFASSRIAVAKLSANGTPVAGFGSSGVATLSPPTDAYAIAGMADGRVVIAGDFYTSATTTKCLAARLTASGTLDATFGSGGLVMPTTASCGRGWGVALLPGDRVLLGANGFTNQVVIMAVQLLSDGSYDHAFGGGTGIALMDDDSAGQQAMARQADGKLVFSSLMHPTDDTSQGVVARMNADGSPDASFGTNGVSVVAVPGATHTSFNGVAAGGGRVYASGATTVGDATSLVVAALTG